MRLFIAIAIPPDVRKEIASVQRQLRRHCPVGAIHWSQPAQFHITLNFLGEVAVNRVEMLEKSISHICDNYPALNLAARGIGFFPNVRKPKVVWVGIKTYRGQLTKLHRLLEGALRPFMSVVKAEKFSSHITLGRFERRHHSSIENLLKCATDLRQKHFGDWVARKVKIVRSELTATGVTYSHLTSYSLSAGKLVVPRLSHKNH